MNVELHTQHHDAGATFDIVKDHIEQSFNLRAFAAAMRVPSASPLQLAAYEKPLSFRDYPGFSPTFFGAPGEGVVPTQLDRLAVPGALAVFDKREDLHQPGHNYKIHGARFALLNMLSNAPEARIAVTGSAGNHAISLAVAVQQINSLLPAKLRKQAHAYCRRDISPIKEERLHRLGAVVHAEHGTLEEALLHAEADAKRQDEAVFIPPFDHPLVIAGQALLTFTTFAQLKNKGVDLRNTNFLAYEPVGGGGKAAGAAFAMKTLIEWGVLGEESAVVGVEVEQNDSNARALAGRPPLVPAAPGTTQGPDTLDADCEGTATIETGYFTLPVLRHFTDGISVIPKDFMVEACGKLMQAHNGTPPELAGALSLGGLLYDMESGKDSRYATHQILTTTTGANISRELLLKVATECLDTETATVNAKVAALNIKRYAEGQKPLPAFKVSDPQERTHKASERPVLRVWRGMQNG